MRVPAGAPAGAVGRPAAGPGAAPRGEAAALRRVDAGRLRAEQSARLAALRAARDPRRAEAALAQLTQAAASGRGNLLEATIAALQARATLGECTAALERVWPRHRARAEYSAGAYAAARPRQDAGWKAARAAVAALRDAAGRAPAVLIAKLGQDGHDRGAKAVAGALADAGFAAHLGGLFDTPESVAQAAARLGVDAVGVSSLAGAHAELVPRLAACLRATGLGHLPLVLGGVVPDADHDALARAGVAAIFGPGTPMEDVAQRLAALIAASRAGRAEAAAVAG